MYLFYTALEVYTRFGMVSYTQCAMFLVDFHSPVDDNYQGSLNLDSEYQDFNFWFAREDGGNWDLVDMGY